MEHLLPFAATSAAAARALLRRDLRGSSVPDGVRDDALLVVSELVGNAVRHGASRADGLRVAWSWSSGALRVEVSEGGAGPVHRAREVCRGGSLDSDEGGRGLAIVARLARAWGVDDERGGARVWAELPLPAGGVDAGRGDSRAHRPT